MRADFDFTYQEIKDGVHDNFIGVKEGDLDGAENAVYAMIDEWNDIFEDGSADSAIWFVAVGEYEIRHNLLQDVIKQGCEYYIPKIENGDFRGDILESERDELLKDIKFVKEKLNL